MKTLLFLLFPFLLFAQSQPAKMADALGFWIADSAVFSDAGTTPATNGQGVYQWNSIRGAAPDLIQTTAGSRPTLGTGAQNSKASLSFDGIGKTYIRSGNLFTNNNTFTVFLVVAYQNNSALGLAVSHAKGTATTARIYLGNNNTDIYQRAGGDASTDIETSTATLGQYYIAVLQGSGGTVYSWINNEDAESAAFTNNATVGGWGVGAYYNGSSAGTYFKGNIAAIAFFDEVVSELNRKQIMDWLGYDYYALTGYSLQTLRVLSFTPETGAPGTEVTITGVNFTGASAVSFGGVAASFNVDNATTITATVPVGGITGVITVASATETDDSETNFTVTELSTTTTGKFKSNSAYSKFKGW